MLEQIQELPDGVIGLRARGTVSKDDYERVVLPAFQDARREGRRVRFLYQLGEEFEGFTAAAAWEDTKVGLRYLRLFERCAVVSDLDWVRVGSRALGALMPCPLRVFANSQFQDAVAWLEERQETVLAFQILEDRGVVVVEPHGRLRAEDFDVLEARVDDWIERTGRNLQGLVVHARAFPGWEDLGSALRHLQFIRDHHREIPRVAWAVDSKMGALGPALGKHFVAADIERFDADALDEAIAWVSGPRERGPEADG